MDFLGQGIPGGCSPPNMPVPNMARRRSMREAMLEIESGELNLPPRKPSILHQPPPMTLLGMPIPGIQAQASIGGLGSGGGLGALGAMMSSMDTLGATAVAVAAPRKNYTALRIDLMAGRRFFKQRHLLENE
jgi:hypothetical protein